MLAIKVDDLKSFTTELFSRELFDKYYVTDIEISTYNTFSINGSINKSYYEDEESKSYSYWKDLKPLCFDLIKGKRLPVSFKIVLKLDEYNIEKFIEDNSLDIFKDKLKECFINIIYEDKALTLTNGIFLNDFILDKSAQSAWDKYILDILDKANISYINN